MPSWNIHLEAGSYIADKLKLTGKKRQDFLVGCIIPDINNGYINDPGIVKPHHETHYAYDQKSSLNYYAENKSKIDNESPVYLGYLFHLYTDGFFNYDFYRNIKRHPFSQKSEDEKRDIKHHDFWLYDTNYHHTIDLTKDEADQIAEAASRIKAVEITGDDILGALAILKRADLNDDIKNDKYIFYTKEALDNLLEDMCESFTNDYLTEGEHA